MTPIQLVVDARNPGEYLAVCGLIEVLGRYDRSATSGWRRAAGFAPEVPSASADICDIEADIDELRTAEALAEALGARGAWMAVTESGRVPLADAVGKWSAGIELTLPNGDIVVIDHWYESAFVRNGGIVAKVGKSGKPSRGRGWKFWAGQQDKNKGATGLVLDLVDGAAKLLAPMRMQDLLTGRVAGRSPLRTDAASNRSSLDRGISANDAEKQAILSVRPCLELLAAIGASAFFPPRRYGTTAPTGTVGIHGRRFRYCLWLRSVPISLARMSARVLYCDGIDFEAAIGGKEYAYLKYARPAGAVPMDQLSDDGNYEEEGSDE